MNLGRFKLGQFVPIAVTCLSEETPYAPTAAPTVTIYDASSARVLSSVMPVVDKVPAPGFFVLDVLLNSDFSAGHYSVAINYVANSTSCLVVMHFEVLPIGNANGAVISQFFYERPQARFLVQKLSSAARRFLKNPRSS